jgi:hypothetical protein
VVKRGTLVETPTGRVCCLQAAVPLSRGAIHQDGAPVQSPGKESLASQATEEPLHTTGRGTDGALYCWYCDAKRSP